MVVEKARWAAIPSIRCLRSLSRRFVSNAPKRHRVFVNGRPRSRALQSISMSCNILCPMIFYVL